MIQRKFKKGEKVLNFNDKYTCDSILGVYKYGRDNSVILKKAIDGYDKMSDEEQHKNILEKFSYVKRAVSYSDDELVEAIKNDDLKLAEYEHLRKTVVASDRKRYSKETIELLVRYDIVKMIKKKNWTMEDVTKIFETNKKKIMERLYLYTGEAETKPDKNGRKEETKAEEIYNRLHVEKVKDGKFTPKVNFINEFLTSEKQDYDCEVFFDDKPIIIYKSEIEAIKKINRKYHTNEKDGRRIVRLVCLLLAWQKAFQNKYYNHRLDGYALLPMDDLLKYNPIVENVNGRTDSVAMISDRKKLFEDGYISLMLPEVPAPREDDCKPELYYKLSFCIDKNAADDEVEVLRITNFENLWEQIFVATFKEFDILEEPKEKDIKQGEIRKYDKKLKVGRVYIADKDKEYSFSGTGNYKIGDEVKVYVNKKGDAKILKFNKNGKPDNVYVTYKAVKRCSTCGKMFYAKQMGNGTGNCDVCNRR